VTGAGYTFLALGPPFKVDSKDNSTMSQGADEEIRSRTQQSALASQRAAEAGQRPAAGRFAQWFPLGAKEGFDQWVSSRRLKMRPQRSY
jgi:hypothetical protein